MEYEFDKEIDSLLRRARPETAVSAKSNAHLDADEISLFAENALTQKARMRATEHLADCAKCRKILSNVIVLNAEEFSENLHAENPKSAVTEGAVPWYRKIFAFPQLAYTMGGLTVLLAGMIGYVMLQSYNESKSSSVAQMERNIERPRGASGADSEGETVTVESYSANAANSASVASNTTVTTANTATNVVAAKPNAPGSNSSSNAATSTARKDESAVSQSAPSPTVTNSLAEREQSADDKSADAVTNYSTDSAARAGSPPNYKQNEITRNQTTITPDSQNVQSRRVEELPVQGRQTQNLPMVLRAPRVGQAAPPPSNDAPKEKAEKKPASEKSKSVGGKDFVYKDNVWYDKAYKQQKTVNVRRNSEEYRKLDAGLRSIADNLGGTVVLVWNGQAYRIQ